MAPTYVADPVDAAGSFEARLAQFPGRLIRMADISVGYRMAPGAACGALPLVLLHGIGSGAASWVQQLEALGGMRCVLAWDAPGYGQSTPLERASPTAADYAHVLARWLDALGIPCCIMVGHSLGAIMAGAFAALYPARARGLLLISPAAGYGAASEEVRTAKRESRLAMLAELGPEGLAQKRSANMLSAHADEASRAWVRWNMARVVPHGYAQATHLLANADLATDLAALRGRVRVVGVAAGSDDTITPPDSCARLAEVAHVPLQIVPGAGHAGYVEMPTAYNTLITAFCRRTEGQG